MGYEINLGNGEWATGQGGMAMTVTDTDTGVKEALLMGCDRNSPKTAVNKDGLLYDVLPYEPSVTYVDGVGVLNNEPQSETRVGYTEKNFENSYWTKSRATVIDENLSVSGSFFSRLTETTDTGLHGLVRSGMGANTGVDCCFSVKVKKGTSEKVGIRFGNQVGNGGGLVVLDLNDGSIFSNENPSDLIPYIQSFPNGVYRFSVVAINTTTATQTIQLSLVDENGNASYTGDVNNYVYFTEINIVNESSPTSYIRSLTSATQTRLADTGFQTPDISKYIDSTQGSFEVELKALSDNQTERAISLSNGTDTNRIKLSYSFGLSNSISYEYRVAGDRKCDITASVSSIQEFIKIKATWKKDEFELYVDDVLLGSDNSGDVGGQGLFNKLSLDSGFSPSYYYGQIKSIKIS